jgi:hypothetical protein
MSIADSEALYDKINNQWPVNGSKECPEFRKHVATFVVQNYSRGNLTHAGADKAVSRLMDTQENYHDLVDRAWRDREFETLGECRNVSSVLFRSLTSC